MSSRFYLSHSLLKDIYLSKLNEWAQTSKIHCLKSKRKAIQYPSGHRGNTLLSAPSCLRQWHVKGTAQSSHFAAINLQPTPLLVWYYFSKSFGRGGPTCHRLH